jgi:lysozyme family protein
VVDFNVAFDRTLGHEGGYVNNPRDPGGETNWGISKRSYPNVDIKNLTREGAKAIYYEDFWVPCGQQLDDAVQYQVFDAAVNHGIGNAIRMLQRAVGVADDGHWGPHSQSRYENTSTTDVLMRFLAERLEFMVKLIRFDTFGRGWSRRIAQNLRFGALDT